MVRRILLALMLPLFFTPVPAHALKWMIIEHRLRLDESNRSFGMISSIPADDSRLNAPPETVTITFSQAVDPSKSRIQVINAYGQIVSQDDAADITPDAKSLTVSLPAGLASGRYTVKWRAQCQCDRNNTVNDRFHFTVR